MTDVTLVVEGSYPYVTGGVSAWTQQLIEGLPDVSFSVAHLGGSGQPRYARPANLLEVIDLPVDPETGAASGDLPDSLVYHALATGSAGAAAARGARERGSGFILSEHGLAWLEAELGFVGYHHHGLTRRVDAGRIRAQARAAYVEAFAVTAVCDWSARRQESLGATGIRVIQNTPAQRSTPRLRDVGAPPLVGFVGRVVRVKDVRTFIEACRLIADELPPARFVVVGPLDHEPAYADECLELAASYDLDLEFTGTADPYAWYPRLDALVLTSLSEAQPLVAVEAMAAGVPVVATDVGGCAELLRGCGLITQTRDPQATAEATLRVLQDDRLRGALTAAAFRRIESRHNADSFLHAFGTLYEAAA